MKKRILTAVTLSVLSVLVFCTVAVGAVTPPEQESSFRDPYRKALLEGVYQCYQWNYFNNEVDLSDYESFTSITNDQGENDSWEAIALPNSMNKLNDSNVSCEQLFLGYKNGNGDNSFSGLFNMSRFPVKEPTRSQAGSDLAIREFLVGMGYVVNDANDQDIRCVEVGYITTVSNNYTSTSTEHHPKLCAEIKTEIGGPYGGEEYVYRFTEGYGGSDPFEIDVSDQYRKAEFKIKGVKDDIYINTGIKYDKFLENFFKIIGEHEHIGPFTVAGTNDGTMYQHDVIMKNGTDVDYLIYSLSESGNIYKLRSDYPYAQAIRYFSSREYTSIDDSHMTGQLIYSKAETRLLYEEYFSNFYGVDIRNVDGVYVKQISSDSNQRIIDEGNYKTFHLLQDLDGDGDYESYKEYLISKTPAKNSGNSEEEMVYKIDSTTNRFCVKGKKKYNCRISYEELIDAYNNAVEEMFDDKKGKYVSNCITIAHEALDERYEYAKRLVYTLPEQLKKYIGRLKKNYEEGSFVDGYGVTIMSLRDYEDVFNRINNEIYQSETTEELHSLLMDLLHNTTVVGDRITNYPDEELSTINDLVEKFKIEYEGYWREIQERYNNAVESVESHNKPNGDGDGIWKINNSNGAFECTAMVPTPPSILTELDKYLSETIGLDLPRLNTIYTSPFSADDISNQTAQVFSGTPEVCYENSGNLGWLICPVIQVVSGVGNYMWDKIENQYLKIPTAEIFNKDAGVYSAWRVVRGVANIIFAILFLIVIFSQLTGVGIDNYGIKKILPKLILVAILVNLSWILCELAVDLSNIFGNGLNSMLTGFSNDTLRGISLAGESGAAGWLTIILGGAGLGVFLFFASPLLLASAGLAVLGFIITIVAAIIVLYLVLMVREVGIIMAIILAPVAIVGYALPNTEKTAKKWLDLFKALLLAYPICGLAVGSGRLAGAVLARIGATTGNESMNLAAMIVQVLPFFFIPSILKKSLSLLGNIGAKISATGKSLGRRASKGVQSGIKNTKNYKEWSARQNSKVAARRAHRIMRRYQDENGNLREGLSERQRSLYNKATQTAGGWEAEIDAAHGDAVYRNAKEKRYAESFARMENRDEVENTFNEAIRAIGNGADAEKAGAALDELVKRGGIQEAMEALYNEKTWEEMDDNVRKRIIQKMGGSNVLAFKAFNAYREKGGKGSFKQWYTGANKDIDNGSKVAESKYANYMEYLNQGGVDVLNSCDKDELKFMRNSVRDDKTKIDPAYYERLAHVMLSSQSSDSRQTARDIISASDDVKISDLGLTAEMLCSMREEDVRFMMDKYKDKNAIREQLKTQIEDLKNDPRTRSRMNKKVQEMLGLIDDNNSGGGGWDGDYNGPFFGQ